MKDLMLVRSDSQEASEGLAMLDPRNKTGWRHQHPGHTREWGELLEKVFGKGLDEYMYEADQNAMEGRQT